MKDGICPKCSATTIIPGVKIYGHANLEQPLTVKLSERPKNWFSRGTRIHRLRAWICGTCGYSELYVNDPQELFAIYQARQQ